MDLKKATAEDAAAALCWKRSPLPVAPVAVVTGVAPDVFDGSLPLLALVLLLLKLLTGVEAPPPSGVALPPAADGVDGVAGAPAPAAVAAAAGGNTDPLTNTAPFHITATQHVLVNAAARTPLEIAHLGSGQTLASEKPPHCPCSLSPQT